MHENWNPLGVVFEGNPIDVGGLNPWQHDWHSIDAPTLVLPHPTNPSQRHSARVYELKTGDSIVRFAAAELSANVWGFYAPMTD